MWPLVHCILPGSIPEARALISARCGNVMPLKIDWLWAEIQSPAGRRSALRMGAATRFLRRFIRIASSPRLNCEWSRDE